MNTGSIMSMEKPVEVPLKLKIPADGRSGVMLTKILLGMLLHLRKYTLETGTKPLVSFQIIFSLNN